MLYTLADQIFLSTPSGWRATPGAFGSVRESTISIHALRVEGDFAVYIRSAICLYFYPRPPGGGRPDRITKKMLAMIFLSTPSGWRATWCAQWNDVCEYISIHALRVEGDCAKIFSKGIDLSISIHALRVEGDFAAMSLPRTLPYFYPRPPGGGRLRQDQRCAAASPISIHALRVEGDLRVRQSDRHDRGISIHALRVEGDSSFPYFLIISSDFYPRPPGGGRRFSRCFVVALFQFLSTPSGWRATVEITPRWRALYFYPRPPGGGRRRSIMCRSSFTHFYPRPPGGGRQLSRDCYHCAFAFLSTPSGWRATSFS